MPQRTTRYQFILKSLKLIVLGIALGYLARFVLGPPNPEEADFRKFHTTIDNSNIDPEILHQHEISLDGFELK